MEIEAVGTGSEKAARSEGPRRCPSLLCAAACCHCRTGCGLLVGLDGLHAAGTELADDVGLLTVRVEPPRLPIGCPTCGVIAVSHGCREVTLIDAPCFDLPVRLIWRKRTWKCDEPACATKVVTEQDEQIARPRTLLTTRACW